MKQTFVNDLRYISSGVAGASSYTAEAERLIVLFCLLHSLPRFLFFLDGVLDDIGKKAISQDSKKQDRIASKHEHIKSFLLPLSFAWFSSEVMVILSSSLAGRNQVDVHSKNVRCSIDMQGNACGEMKCVHSLTKMSSVIRHSFLRFIPP